MHPPRPAPVVDAGRCPRTRTSAASCNLCESACPAACIALGPRSLEIGVACTGCGACHAVCPTGALRDPTLDDLDLARRALRLDQPRFHCTRAEPEEESIEVPCLARISAATLLRIAQDGAGEVTVRTSGCAGCVQETGRRIAFARSATVCAEVLAARKSAPLPVHEVDRPGERDARAGSCSRRELFRKLRAPREAPRGAAKALHAQLRASGAGELELTKAAVGRPAPAGYCDACGLCARLCPTGALLEKRDEHGFSLWRTNTTCVACGTCAAVCSFGSLRVDRVWDPAAGGAELIAFPLAACRDCGAPVRAGEDRCVPCNRRRGITPGRTSPSCAAR